MKNTLIAKNRVAKRTGRAAVIGATMLGLTAAGLALAAPASAVTSTNLVTGPLAGGSYYATLDGKYGTYSGPTGLADAVASGAAPVWTYPSTSGVGTISSAGLCLQGPDAGKEGLVAAVPCVEGLASQVWYASSFPGSLSFKNASASGPLLRITGADLVTNKSSGTVWEAGLKLAVPAAVAPTLATPKPGSTITPDTPFTGTGPAGETVTITDTDGTVLGTARVDDQGGWSTTLSPAPRNGSIELGFAVSGPGGTSSEFARGTYDMTGNPRPLTVVTPNLSGSNSLSNGAAVTGTGEPDSTVTITDKDGTIVGTADVDEFGNWTTILSGLPQGPNTLTATAALPGGTQEVVDLGSIIVVSQDESTPLMDPAIAGGVGVVLLAGAMTFVAIRRRMAAAD